MRWMRSATLALGVLTPFLAAAPRPALAGGGLHDPGSIFVLTIPNFKELRMGVAEGDLGAFLGDPEVIAIGERVTAGLTALVRMAAHEAAGGAGARDGDGINDGSGNGDETAAEAARRLEQLGSWLSAYLRHHWNMCDGLWDLSVGLREAPGGPQPQMLLHFEGPESFDTHHRQLIDMMLAALPGELERVSFSAGGVEFMGCRPKAAPDTGLPMTAPDGLFIGRQGNHYYLGISRGGLEEYVNAGKAPAEGVAPAPRLAQDGFYQRARAVTGTGHVEAFINMQPVWRLVKQFLPMASGGNPFIGMGFDLSGLDQWQGYHVAERFSKEGASVHAFMGLASRGGIWTVLPDANQDMKVAPFIARDAMQAIGMRMRLDRTMDLVYRVGEQLAGPDSRAMIDEQLAEATQQIGADPRALLAALEGDAFCDLLPPTADSMMGGVQPMLIGLRLTDAAPFRAVLTKLSGPESMLPVRTETYLGRELLIIGEPEAAGFDGMSAGGSDATVGCTVDGDWLLIGVPAQRVHQGLRTRDAGPEAQLATDPRFLKGLARLGTSGVGYSYYDMARAVGGTLDAVRPMLGFLPLAMGKMGEDPAVAGLFDPRNLPSQELVARYFGVVMGTIHHTPAGLEMKSFMPSVARPAPATDEKAPQPL